MITTLDITQLKKIVTSLKKCLTQKREKGTTPIEDKTITIEVRDGKTTFSTKGGLLQVSGEMPSVKSQDLREGKITLGFLNLYELLKGLRFTKKEQAAIKIEKIPHAIVKFSTPKNDFKLTECLIKHEELPEQTENMVSIPTENIATAIKKTVQFCSKDVSRQILNGLYLNAGEEEIIFCGTDGHILSEYSISTGSPTQGAYNIDVKTAKAIEDLLSAMPSPQMQICKEKKGIIITIKTDKWQITTITNHLEYPPYREAIPSEVEKEFTINQPELLKILEGIETQQKITKEMRIRGKAQSIRIQTGTNAMAIENTQTNNTPADLIPISYSIVNASKIRDRKEELYTSQLKNLVKQLPPEDIVIRIPSKKNHAITLMNQVKPGYPEQTILIMPIIRKEASEWT